METIPDETAGRNLEGLLQFFFFFFLKKILYLHDENNP